MIYSQFYFKKDLKMPTFFGVLLVVLVISFFLKIMQKNASYLKASAKEIKKLLVTDISYTSANIYWFTEEKQTGWVIYGKSANKLDLIALDNRDLSAKKGIYYNHFVTLIDLSADTKYYFAIVSHNRLILKNDKIPFSFKTLSNQVKLKNLKPAYGKVIDLNNQPIKDAIVLLSLNEKYYSNLTKGSGEWLIPINIEEEKISEKVQIEIISEDKKISSIITSLDKITPLPQVVVIGKNYNFYEENQVLSVQTSFSSSSGEKIDIFYPKENASIPGVFPLIKGMALPNSEVLIIVDSSKKYSAKVKADAKGFWSFSVPTPLALGKNRVTITTKDQEGKVVTIARNFYIIGDSGNAVLGEATPSATTIPSPTPTLILSPTTIPTPTSPISGKNYFNLVFLSLSLLFLGVGLMLVF